MRTTAASAAGRCHQRPDVVLWRKYRDFGQPIDSLEVDLLGFAGMGDE